MNSRRRRTSAVVAGLTAVLLTAVGCSSPETPTVRPSPVLSTASSASSGTSTVGVTLYGIDRAPTLPILTGADLTGASLTIPVPRASVTIVNVWASWCPPCVAEMPRLRAISTRFAADDVSVVGVATRDTTAAAVGFLSATGFDLPSLADTSGAQAARWGSLVPASAVPSTLLVDSAGRVRARWIGTVDSATLATQVCVTLREEHRRAASCPG